MTTTPQVWAARNAARIVIYGLLAILVVVVYFKVTQWREDAKTGADRIEQRDQVAAAAQGIGYDFTQETTGRAHIERAVTAQNAQLARDLETLRNANPDLDHWLRADIPNELRQLAKTRREARDRLGAATAGSAGADQGTAAPGTNPAR